jgi:lipoprotein-anchoring transpeptidase ErfK/SrfK
MKEMEGMKKMRGRTLSAVVALFMFFSAAAGVMTGVTDTAQAKTTKRTYLIKVNTKKNVVTVYKRQNLDGSFKYKAIRAIRVSCGRATSRSSTTPRGTYKVKGKQKWCLLYGNVWGRYSIRFYRDYLFHTVPYRYYKNPKSIIVREYKKLGKKASAGCVRMPFIDEMWMSRTCPKGTKVIVYKSSNPGPLGKPKAVQFNKKAGVLKKNGKIKKSLYYDPTDPVKKNKGYNLKAPVITVSTSEGSADSSTTGKTADSSAGDASDSNLVLNIEIEKGSTFDPMSGVTAKDKRSFQDLTNKIKYTVYKKETSFDSQSGQTVSWKTVKKVDTSEEGAEYRIDYTCYYKYCSKYKGKLSRNVKIAAGKQ